jgi:hypothetical protein
MEYSFVSEFELLKLSQSHKDITMEPWAVPANREVTTKYFKILRVHEEIQRLNVEMRRLRTSIHDEHIMYEDKIQCLHEFNPLLAAEIQRHYNTRRCVNVTHILHLNTIEGLSGFTGVCGPGTCLGTMNTYRGTGVDNSTDERASTSVAESVGDERLESGEDEDGGGAHVDVDDELNEQISGLCNAMAEEPKLTVVRGIPDSMLFKWTM